MHDLNYHIIIIFFQDNINNRTPSKDEVIPKTTNHNDSSEKNNINNNSNNNINNMSTNKMNKQIN